MVTGNKQSVKGGLQHRGFPFFSTLSLLYPLAALVHAINAGAPFIAALGFGLASLGYLLLVAGIFAGRFRALALYNRWEVLKLAAITWLLGTVLANIH